jgi:predicted nucleotidyltransferase
MIMTAHTIQAILREHKTALRTRYGIKSIGLFGSYVRNESSPESDADILVEFERPIDYFDFLDLEERLQALLGIPVDLVEKESLKPYISRRVLSEVVTI